MSDHTPSQPKTKEIPLTQGKVAIVDASDYEWLMQWKWRAVNHHHTWYAIRRVFLPDGKDTTRYMHRDILEAGAAVSVDHRDGNGLNNVRVNLRFATLRQNCANKSTRKNKSSRYKGVSWSKEMRKWEAYISTQGKQRRLGFYESEKDAALAYDRAAIEIFGEFAKPNFPPGEEV